MSSSRLRQDQERPRPFYGKDAWTGVHRRRSADAAAGEVSPMTSRYSPASAAGEERKKQGNTKLSYEKVAWTWSDRRRNFSTGLGAASPVAASPLLRDETKSRSYSKSSWEKGSTRSSSRPLSQVGQSSRCFSLFLLVPFLDKDSRCRAAAQGGSTGRKCNTAMCSNVVVRRTRRPLVCSKTTLRGRLSGPGVMRCRSGRPTVLFQRSPATIV